MEVWAGASGTIQRLASGGEGRERGGGGVGWFGRAVGGLRKHEGSSARGESGGRVVSHVVPGGSEGDKREWV